MGAAVRARVAWPLRGQAQPVRVLRRHQRLGRHEVPPVAALQRARRRLLAARRRHRGKRVPELRVHHAEPRQRHARRLDRAGRSWLVAGAAEDHGDGRVQERRRDLPAVGRRHGARSAARRRSAVHRDLAERASGLVSKADYDTSSYLKTSQHILGVDPLPCDADPASVEPMSDLFSVPLPTTK